jgi:hypothetical protein
MQDQSRKSRNIGYIAAGISERNPGRSALQGLPGTPPNERENKTTIEDRVFALPACTREGPAKTRTERRANKN